MIVTELRLLNFVLIFFLLTTPIIIVDAGAQRCYLCSQSTLAECVGTYQPDSAGFTSALRYYTEPCNGQCILFRNEEGSTIRGCSWTYGHMTPKPTGWHDISPGIKAYFCDSYLCNHGTIEQPDTAMIRSGMINDGFALSPQQTLDPQQLFLIPENTPQMMHIDQQLPPIKDISHQLRQCYLCTARLTGCGEYLDPRYASQYIQPCASSCIIFRNPSDHNLITRDCSTTWPQMHGKSGLHKILGSDAFFCQESLCNGISFDFIMGIFHNQLPAVIKFPSIPIIQDTSTTTFSTFNPITTTATASVNHSIATTINIEDDNVVWEDPDLDFVIVESKTTTIPIASTTSPFPIESSDSTDIIYESSTIPLESVEHFDFIDNIPGSSTITGGMAVAEENSQFNWWDISEALFSPLVESFHSPLTTTVATNNLALISSTIKLENSGEDDWEIFNTSSIPLLSPFENPSDSNSEVDFDINDYFPFSTLSTTPIIDLINNNNNTQPFVPYYFTDYKNKDQLLGLIKPVSTLVMPPFSWMLNLAKQNQSELKDQPSLINKNFRIISSTILTNKTKKNKTKKINLKKIFHNDLDQFSEYCNKKQCQYGGRLNADCVCICLPAFNGNNCERVNCNQEPANVCDFVLEYECKSEYVRYLCPKFCQMNICSSNRSS